MNGDIKVLVADDSATTRLFLAEVLDSDPQLRVVGSVGDGQAAVDFVAKHKPDVVLMDLYMPRLDGFEATRRIMETHPLPIVICSATADPKAMDIVFRALEAGAVACIEKPTGREHADFANKSARLIERVKLMAEVKVVRRSARRRNAVSAPLRGVEAKSFTGVEIVGIGASTGGPPALQTILADLPKDFPLPIVVVQHIARGFLSAMAEWLNATTPLHVQIASHGIVPEPGHVYLAPDDIHMGIGASTTITLTREQPENGLRPAVSFLFRSLAQTYGASAIAVMLTGMGRDGAEEMKLMRDKGSMTIAQDRESSVVHGMPGEAIAIGGATHVMPADKIANALVTAVKERRASRRS